MPLHAAQAAGPMIGTVNAQRPSRQCAVTVLKPLSSLVRTTDVGALPTAPALHWDQWPWMPVQTTGTFQSTSGNSYQVGLSVQVIPTKEGLWASFGERMMKIARLSGLSYRVEEENCFGSLFFPDEEVASRILGGDQIVWDSQQLCKG